MHTVELTAGIVVRLSQTRCSNSQFFFGPCLDLDVQYRYAAMPMSLVGYIALVA